MRYGQAGLGRVFVVRLESGDIINESLEKVARDEGIKAAAVILLGGADSGSRLVAGPDEGDKGAVPYVQGIEGVHEMTGTGTIFPGPDGRPSLHMHIAAGRKDKSVTGCTRSGVKTWLTGEAVIIELAGCAASREREPGTGFDLLQP